MLLSPGSAENVSKIRVKNREPVPSYRMDRNDDEIDAMMFFFEKRTVTQRVTVTMCCLKIMATTLRRGERKN
ncbi:hypothetical protein OUZ56_003058 [Daphnia magna]|uniref:Uncharacterized protein n=1 Tax=Daphnia magna TaxID=35525 RepID=A0ABR0A7L5_9CRUS|nr:hypothetical protein OUZ56_003058 [Daphnia magna]